MDFFKKKIVSIGITSNLDLDLQKKVRLTNILSFLVFAILLIGIVFSIIGAWSFTVSATATVFLFLVLIPVVLNAQRMYLASRIAIVLVGYFIVLVLAIQTGRDTHYHHFLYPGVGYALVLFSNREIAVKWILAFFALFLWVALQIVFEYSSPFVAVNESQLSTIRNFHDIFTFILLVGVFTFLLQESELHLTQIESKTEELTQVNNELDHFAQVVSHDLKAPLNSMIGLLSLIDDDSYTFDSGVAEILGKLAESQHELKRMIDSILEFARVVGIGDDWQEITIEELVAQFQKKLKLPENSAILIEGHPPVLMAPKTQLEQVFDNIVGNAFKYADTQRNVVVRVNATFLNSDFYKVEISDNGMGIATENMDQIFDLFHTGHNERREDSTGVGLAIVKKIVEKLGGEVGVTSELGKGSTFWFTWPVNSGDAR